MNDQETVIDLTKYADTPDVQQAMWFRHTMTDKKTKGYVPTSNDIASLPKDKQEQFLTKPEKQSDEKDLVGPDMNQTQLLTGLQQAIAKVGSDFPHDPDVQEKLAAIAQRSETKVKDILSDHGGDKAELADLQEHVADVTAELAAIRTEARLAEVNDLVANGGLPETVGETVDAYSQELKQLREDQAKNPSAPEKRKQDMLDLEDRFEIEVQNAITEARQEATEKSQDPEIEWPGLPALESKLPDKESEEFVLGEDKSNDAQKSKALEEFHEGETRKKSHKLGLAGYSSVTNFYDSSGDKAFKRIVKDGRTTFECDPEKHGPFTPEKTNKMVTALCEEGCTTINVSSKNPKFRMEAWLAAKEYGAIHGVTITVKGAKPEKQWESILLERLKAKEAQGVEIKRWPDGAKHDNNSFTFDTDRKKTLTKPRPDSNEQDQQQAPKQRVHDYKLTFTTDASGVPQCELIDPKNNAPDVIKDLVKSENKKIKTTLANNKSDAYWQGKDKKDFKDRTKHAFDDEKKMQQLMDGPAEDLDKLKVTHESEVISAKVYKRPDGIAIIRHLGRQAEPKVSVASPELAKKLSDGLEITAKMSIGQQVKVGASNDNSIGTAKKQDNVQSHVADQKKKIGGR